MEIPYGGLIRRDEWVAAYRLHFNITRWSEVFNLVVAGLVMVPFSCLFFSLFQKIEVEKVLMMVITFCFALSRMFQFFILWNAGKNYDRGHGVEEVRGMITEDSITSKTVDAVNETKWSRFLEFKESEVLVMLYSQKNLFQYFPRSFFQSDADWMAFRGLVHHHVKPAKKPWGIF